MSRIPLAGRRVWLTGASTGIGRACALEFARRGARLAISARNAPALEALASEIRSRSPNDATDSVLAVPLDVRDRGSNAQAAATIEQAWGGLDTAVFNAGVREFVDEDEFDASPIDRALATNLHGLVYGMEAGIPLLRKGVHPHLAGVSSAAAYMPLPRSEAYGTSKAAVRYLLDSYRYRAESKGMWVTSIHPGFVATAMTCDVDYPVPFMVSPEEAARRIADGIERRRREIHFPRRLTVVMKLASFLPLGIYQTVVPRLVKVPPRFEPTSK